MGEGTASYVAGSTFCPRDCLQNKYLSRLYKVPYVSLFASYGGDKLRM